MTKQDIINQVCNSSDLSRSKAEEAVETVIGLIKDALGNGEAVILRRFGTFSGASEIESVLVEILKLEKKLKLQRER